MVRNPEVVEDVGAALGGIPESKEARSTELLNKSLVDCIEIVPVDRTLACAHSQGMPYEVSEHST